ncbi:BadF/BadG/BcrA/BcrD ATPase family protein [Streptomyces sp. NPDC005132]|uniref:BadF/BadG/BcrA/BcrD ATPase family protein n=1 Tax=Streptomyces sp. NPDC005132 TaxID=3154294 RepID=UPI0033BC04DA
MTAVLAVDLGKTGCRAVLWTGPDGPEHPVREVPGAPGLAESGGVTAAVAAVTAAAALVHEIASDLPSGRLDAVCVGAAGAAADPAAARSLAELLLDALPTDEVAVTSDAVTAHAGALGGGAGVVLAAGTGAVTVGIGEDGTFARVDGWGPWLGDEGSGAWIGRAGLRAALRSHDGRGPATALTAAAAERYGDLDRLPATVGHSANPARLTAAFAPLVAGAAADGDAVATEIMRDAAAALAEAVVAAARRAGGTRPLPVAVTGGLTGIGAPLMDPFAALLRASGLPLRVTPALGDPLHGARLLALDSAGPHEPLVIRVHRTTAPPP